MDISDDNPPSKKSSLLRKYGLGLAASTVLLGAGIIADRSQRPQRQGIPPPAPVVIPDANLQEASERYTRILELEQIMARTTDPVERDVYARLHQSEHVIGMRKQELPEDLANTLLQKSARKYNALDPIEKSAKGNHERIDAVKSFLDSFEKTTRVPTPDIDLSPSYRHWDSIKRELNPHEEILIAANVLNPEGVSRAECNRQRDFEYVRDYEYAQGYLLKRKIEEMGASGELQVVADKSVIDAVELIKKPNPHMRNSPLAITAGVSYNPFNPEPAQLMQDLGHIKVTAKDGQTLTIRLNMMQGGQVMQALMENSDPADWKTPSKKQKIELQRAADTQLQEVAPYLGGQMPSR